MKKYLPAIAVVLLVVAGLAVYLYSEHLLQTPSGDRAQPASPAGDTSAADPADSATGADGTVARAHALALFWRDAASGRNEVWRFATGVAPARHPVQAVDGGWQARVFAPGGWGGDDLLVWRNDGAGQLRTWRLARDGGVAAFEILPYSGDAWRIVAAADADGDGDADLVWTGPNGSIAVWTLQDGKPARKETVGTVRAGWQLIQAADVDGDASAELLWRDPASGRMALWELDGADKAVERNLPGVPAEWTLIGAAQIDGADGDDLLWRNDAGALAIWRGLSTTGAVLVRRRESPEWGFVGLADVDADGRADLLWRHRQNGSMGAWAIADDGQVRDIGLPLPAAGADLVPTGFVVP